MEGTLEALGGNRWYGGAVMDPSHRLGGAVMDPSHRLGGAVMDPSHRLMDHNQGKKNLRHCYFKKKLISTFWYIFATFFTT